MPRQVAALVFGVAALVAALLLYDVWLLWHGLPTVSRAVYEYSREHPLLPFLLGMLVGGAAVHLWGI